MATFYLDLNFSVNKPKVPLCTICANLPIASNAQIIAGHIKTATVDNFTYTTKDWFLHPEVTKRLTDINRPVEFHLFKYWKSFCSNERGIIASTWTDKYLSGDLVLELRQLHTSVEILYPAAVTLGTLEIIPPAFLRKQQPASDTSYNSICPKCGAPAYIGLNNVDCSQKCH